MTYPDWSERTLGLIGEEGFRKIQAGRIAIFGLGGVGGTCFICLLRTGVSTFLLVDGDEVSPHNLNRQILFSPLDIGRKKVEAAFDYAKPFLSASGQIDLAPSYLEPETVKDYSLERFDVVIDCIDDVKAKVALAEHCQKNNIPFLMCLGMGNRIDPSQVGLTTLDKTSTCPLARKMRSELRKRGLDLSRVTVAFSQEPPLCSGPVPASIMTVPSAAGLTLAYGAMKILLSKKY